MVRWNISGDMIAMLLLVQKLSCDAEEQIFYMS